jgi:hypothetical protein
MARKAACSHRYTPVGDEVCTGVVLNWQTRVTDVVHGLVKLGDPGGNRHA